MIEPMAPAENEKHFAELKEAYLAMLAEPGLINFLSSPMRPFDDATVTHWLRTHRQDNIDYAVARNEHGMIVGLVITKTDLVAGFELLGLLVDRAHRRAGAGRALAEYAFARAAEQGYRAVDLHVFADNKPMLALAIDLDCRPIDILHHRRADGMDMVRLRKTLQDKS